MALPIVSGSEVQTQQVAPKLDATAFRNAALSKGRIGAAVGNIGGDLMDISQKFQDNRNARTLLDADLAMRKTADDYRDSLAKNPDERTWVPGFQQQASQLRQNILSGPDVGPDVKRQLTANLDRWQGAFTGEFTTAAQTQSLNRTKHSVIADYTAAARQGDTAGAQAAINLGRQSGALFPEDADRLQKNLPGITQRAQVDTGIANDPGKTLDLLKDQDASGRSKAFPNLDPKTLVTLIGTATRARNTEQTNAAEDLREQLENSPDGTLDPAMLKDQLKQKKITDGAYNSLLNLEQRTKLNEAKANAGELMGEVSLYDPADDKTGQKLRDLKAQAVGLPKGYYDSINTALNRKVKEGKGGGDDGEKVIDRLYTDGVLGSRKDDKGRQAANERRWDLQDALTKWKQQNPEASLHDEREYVQKLAEPDAVAHAKNSLTDASGYVKGKKYKDAKGNTATWDGEKFVEDK